MAQDVYPTPAYCVDKLPPWIDFRTRIYTERVMQLTGVGPGPAKSWRTAYQFAQKAAAHHAASCELCGIHYRFTPATGNE